MPIRQSTLEQHRQPHVILAAGDDFLQEILERFFDSGLTEKEAFLVVHIDDGSYRAERFDRITTALNRQGGQEIFKPLADLVWLPKVWKVTGSDGRMDDSDVVAWARRLDGRALVVEEDGAFAALVYTPARMRGAANRSLLQIYQSFMAQEETGPAGEESLLPAKGLDQPDELMVERPHDFRADDTERMDRPAMANGGGRTPATPVITVPFHTDIRFAHWLRPGATRPLTVQLTQEAAPASASDEVVTVDFEDEFTVETIHIHLDAPGFSERTDTWRKAIDVYSFQDSDKATFILSAGQEEGARQISIDLRHKERLIGNARFVVQVSAAQPVRAGAAVDDALTFRQPPPAVEIPPNPPPPPDVELRVRVDGRRLTYELHSPHQEVDASYARMGGVELTTEPQAYMQERYDELSQWAGQRPADADAVVEITSRLTAIGNSLFLALFPDKLKRTYWKLVKLRQQGLLSSFHIISDEPWIPWEMVKPVDMDTGQADDFLAQGWQVSRWLAGPGQVDHLTIGTARLVAPDTGLSQVKREVDFFATLSQRHVQVSAPVSSLAQVRQIARHGVELLHFSTHGRVDSQSIDRSTILLEDNAELHPDDLLGEAVLGLRRRRPLVFLNTCHGARLGFSLAGLGGWASQMINQVRAGIFVGALWEVNDVLAADFALAFYGELEAGKTLGEAFYTARMGIRARAPANSTWLAYTLYGDPNMHVAWGDGR